LSNIAVVVASNNAPLLVRVSKDVPVDDATTNGLSAPDPCILKVTVDEVAPTPATVPLSLNNPVAKDVGEVNRARNPLVPPVTPVIPNVEVETQRVEVPVAQRSWPRVPDAFTESLNVENSVKFVVARLVVVAVMAVKRVAVAAVVKVFVNVAPVEERPVDEELREVRLPTYIVPKVAFVADNWVVEARDAKKLVVEALVKAARVVVPAVVKVLPKDALVAENWVVEAMEAKRLVVDALDAANKVEVPAVVNILPNVAPVAERLVVEAY
jgi:hypothetical protein